MIAKFHSHLNCTINTDNRLLTANFSIDDIAKILQNLDPNKAPGHKYSHATITL